MPVPLAQATQLVVDAVLKVAELQAVHVVAPAPWSVLVTHPSIHLTQLVADAVL